MTAPSRYRPGEAHSGEAHTARRLPTTAQYVPLSDVYHLGGEWPVVLDLPLAFDLPLAPQVVATRDVDPPWWAPILTAPEREVAVRCFGAGSGPQSGQQQRMCCARKGSAAVTAIRGADHLLVEPLDAHLTSVATRIRRFCLDAAPAAGSDATASFAALRYPAAELAERLAQCDDLRSSADAMRAMGASPSDAVRIAAILMSARRRIEIVAYSAEDSEAGIRSAAGSIGIVDGERGRILASPSMSADGQVWTTLSLGSGHRIEQAVGLLAETLPGGWAP